ncbi:MAG TPA: FtsQ-type POTRA domain-containing protein [Pyrinomonadaceae bacterium]|jgi:cell division protein FtsQ
MLREQVITPRAGRGRARAGGRAQAGAAQRPAPRRGTAGRAKPAAGGAAWRVLRAWLPFAAKMLLAVAAGVAAFYLYRTAASSSFFALGPVDVRGTSRASAEQIERLVRRAVGPTGVWRADLEALRAEIERQPWVRTAAVARVLPSGVRVRVTERTPRAVVRLSTGRLTWVDEDAYVVGTAAPTDQMPAFFLRGYDEAGGANARAENRQRVAKLLELQAEWTAAGLAERVSEVNLDDLRDVRAQLAGEDSQVEVRLGRDDLTKRLRLALQALDEQRQTPRGAHVSYIDMTQGKRAVIGFTRASMPAPAGDGHADAPPAPARSEPRPRRAG